MIESLLLEKWQGGTKIAAFYDYLVLFVRDSKILFYDHVIL